MGFPIRSIHKAIINLLTINKRHADRRPTDNDPLPERLLDSINEHPVQDQPQQQRHGTLPQNRIARDSGLVEPGKKSKHDSKGRNEHP